MSEGLPRSALVLLVAASLTITLAGARAVADIVGPAALALVLVITVHPVRRLLVRRGLPPWLVSLIVVVSVYVLLLGVTVSVIYSIGQLAVLVPGYTADIQSTVDDLGGWLQDRGVGADQVSAMAGALDVGSLVGVASDVFGAVLGLASNLFFIVTLVLFMAFDTEATQRTLAAVREARPDLVDALSSFAHGTRTYFAVSAVFGLVVAVIDGIALELMGVPGAFVWGGAGVRHQLHPQHRLHHRVDPPGADRAPRGRPGTDGRRDRRLLRDQLRDPVDDPAQVTGDALGLSPTSPSCPWCSGPAARPAGRAARGAAQPARPRAARRRRPGSPLGPCR